MRRLSAILFLISFLAGCERDEPIRTYQAAKEEPAPPVIASGDAAEARPAAPWTVPSGWIEDAPRPMRVATLRTSADADAAEIIITRFAAGNFGSLLDNINRWRGMVNLEKIEDEAEQPLAKMSVSGAESSVYDMTGPALDGAPAKRTIVVMVPHDGQVWFFRMVGNADVVEQQKDAFNAFLQTVRFD